MSQHKPSLNADFVSLKLSLTILMPINSKKEKQKLNVGIRLMIKEDFLKQSKSQEQI